MDVGGNHRRARGWLALSKLVLQNYDIIFFIKENQTKCNFKNNDTLIFCIVHNEQEAHILFELVFT